jgi:diazepam-binding inhibitor (GABA receptor modulating acyl-CoA-binding protein)
MPCGPEFGRFGHRAARAASLRSGASKDSQKENPVSDLKTEFETAVAESKQLPEKPDNMTLLKIYALYKQASSGDANGDRPGMTDFVGRAKWDAWNGLKGQTPEQAMQAYIDLIESLK